MYRPLIIAAILLSACTSCVSQAPPAADFVAEQVVPNPEGNVHAFRVDIVKMDRPAPQARYTLSRIPIDKNGVIASQSKLGSPDGYLVPEGTTIKITAAREETTIQTVLVRLYRPGYCTIELKAGEKLRKLKWIPAGDLVSQEKAIDDLVGLPKQSEQVWTTAGVWLRPEVTMGALGLQPGWASKAHRNSLTFAASEYLRVANSIDKLVMPPGEKIRQRLEIKARSLNVYADRQPPKTP